MTKLLATALAVLSAWIRISAESVPLSSTTNYVWHTPSTTNIEGVVMGCPPAYSVIRGEDLAWIEEAAAERFYLRGRVLPPLVTNESWRLKPEFGAWPASETNRFEKFVMSGTNEIVVGYNWETNVVRGDAWKPLLDVHSGGFARRNHAFHDDLGNPSRDARGYLTTDEDAYIQGWKTWPIYMTVTNSIDVEDVVHVQVETNSYIEMSMSDGSTSVHTNSWWYFDHRTNHTHMTEVVRGGIGVAGVFTNGIVKGAEGLTQSLEGEIRSSTLTNWYAELRNLSVLASEASPYVVTGNLETVWHWVRSDVAGGSALQGSYAPDVRSFRLGTESVYVETNTEMEDGSVKSDMEHFVYEYNLNIGKAVLRLDSGFSADLVNMFGHNRILSVAAFGQFSVSHGYSSSRSAASGTDSYDTNDTAVVYCRLDVDANEVEGYGNVTYEIELQGTILEDALYQIGAAYRQWPYAPPLKWPATRPSRSDGVPTTTSRASESWNSRLDSIVLVFRLDPYTSLPSWKEKR